jgi:hypothetical protein
MVITHFKGENSMRKIVVNMNLTLDGVMQAPGRPDEDTRGGFEHGGWALPYFDLVMASAADEGIATRPYMLFGRCAYQDFYTVWPQRADNPFTEVLNNAHKYVASTTLEKPRSRSSQARILSSWAAACLSSR